MYVTSGALYLYCWYVKLRSVIRTAVFFYILVIKVVT